MRTLLVGMLLAIAATPALAHSRLDAHGDLQGLLFVAGLYFAPFLVALIRGHLSSAAIFVFNLLLGWTGLGWILALVWSLTGNTRRNAELYSRRFG